VNESGEVGRNESAKIVHRVVSERLHHEDAGVRRHRVDRAELFERDFCNFLRGFKFTNVAVDQRETTGC
jgi:hypothetical protein